MQNGSWSLLTILVFVFANLSSISNIDGPSSQSSQATDSLVSRVYSWDLIAASQTGNQNKTLQVMNGSTHSLSRFNVEIAVLAPGRISGLPKLLKGREQLIIMKDGTLEVTIKGKTRSLSRGGIAMFMPGDEHSISNKGKQSAVFYIFDYQSKQPAQSESADNNGGSFMFNWDEVEFKKHDKGGRKDFFKRPTSQLARFEMHTTALNPGLESHPPHIHIEEEIILMLKGNVKVHINGKLYPAAPGDVIFYAAGNPHALLNTGSEQAEYFAFQWGN